MSTYTDIFSGNSITPAFPQYESITLSSNITLSWPAQFQNSNNVVATIMVISPTVGGFSVTMPDATQTAKGFEFYINNPTANAFDLLDNTGGLIYAVTGPSVSLFWLDSNLTPAGMWTRIPAGGGSASVTSINAASTSPDLVITGVPITTTGTITFALDQDLLALTSFGAGTGISVRTGSNAWSLRSIAGTVNQITVTNGSGVAGNPNISLSPNITGIASLAVGNLSISLNQIISTNFNGNITLSPNGTGIIQLSKETDILLGNALKFYNISGGNFISFSLGTTSVNQTLLWPTTLAAPGQVLQNDGTGNLVWASITTFGGPSTINALARYSNTTGSLKNSILILDDAGNATGLNTCAIGNILIGSPTAQSITTTLANQDLIVSPNGTGSFAVTGDIKVQPSSLAQRKIRLYNTAGTFFAGLASNATMGANVTWSLPATDSAGAFVSDGAGNLSITSLFSGPSTLNAVPRFANTTGLLKNSVFFITDAGAGTGLVSCVIGAISLGITDNRTITTSLTNLDLQLSANGTGTVYSISDFSIFPRGGVQSSLFLYNTAGTFYAALRSTSTLAANVGWTLPGADSVGVFTSNGAGVMSISPFFAGPSTVNAVPTFANTTGLLQNSLLVITPLGAATGLVSSVIGGISIGLVNSLTISASVANTNLNLTASGTGSVYCNNDFSIFPHSGVQSGLYLYNTAGTFYNHLSSIPLLAANVGWTLPSADVNGLMSSNGAGALTLNTGIVAQGSPNFNIGIGTSTFDATSTRSITFFNGTLAASAPATSVVFQSQAISAGNSSIAWYGSGNGGVTVTGATLNNREIAITVNGVIYYLLARNTP